MQLQSVHHIAIICSNYEMSKAFYTEVLGFSIKHEAYRKDRDSYKLDLALNNQYILELFSFPNPPKRVSQPEATGLRHIAFGVNNLEESLQYLDSKKITHEGVRIDSLTNKKFTFFNDPDNLPIELYEL